MHYGGARLFCTAPYALDAKNENITRAFVMIHGVGRDAENYFRTAGALDNTIVISPRFASKMDAVARTRWRRTKSVGAARATVAALAE